MSAGDAEAAPDVALPPAELELWGTNAVIYSSGSASVGEARQRACRRWADENFLRVVEVCQDRDSACELQAMHRPGVLRVLNAMTFLDGDVMVVVDEDFEEFSADDRKWLREQAAKSEGQIKLVPAEAPKVAS
ncbi:MAG TPA: hypothetical protein VGX23_11785 [Actinocrinis sp.]|nr:hypothetical protein [Actinocrinis sp.]